MYIYNNFNTMNGVPSLNVDLSSPTVAAAPTPITSSSNLTVGLNTSTPLTPEILNSVMAMTNPLEYAYPPTANQSTPKVSQQSSDSHSSSSGSPFDSPMATTPAGATTVKEVTTPTVQQTCSQLIKTSLKLSLEMKRKMSTSDSSSVDTSICKKIKQDLDESSDDELIAKPSRPLVRLSPEDEDRRRRRRERNKIAATKCRMKKRERTVNLVSEAEILEAQNIDLKAQVRSLEMERRSLTDMLQAHAGSCSRADAMQIPNVNTSIVKYLHEIGLANLPVDANLISIKNELAPKTRTNSTRTTQKMQKIPPVNTLRFSTRSRATAMTPVATTTTRNCLVGASPIPDCKPLPSIDMGFCEGDTLTPTNNYCKSLISNSSDCYAMSSPDSGFIKSPVDMSSYPLPQLIKTDYIPNCDSGMMNDTGNTDVEFILKSELTDANDSPYTTVQSADRFLFDGVAEAFDPDMEANASHTMIEPQIDGLKEHMLLHGMNNNNSTHINNNHHIEAPNPNMMHNFVSNLPVISTVPAHSASIIEFNTSCQQYIDGTLLKGDFLSQNCEFLDSQFTTDLDSGVTTFTNSSGCLA